LPARKGAVEPGAIDLGLAEVDASQARQLDAVDQILTGPPAGILWLIDFVPLISGSVPTAKADPASASRTEDDEG
jgi:hypothetical protein